MSIPGCLLMWSCTGWRISFFNDFMDVS